MKVKIYFIFTSLVVFFSLMIQSLALSKLISTGRIFLTTGVYNWSTRYYEQSMDRLVPPDWPFLWPAWAVILTNTILAAGIVYFIIKLVLASDDKQRYITAVEDVALVGKVIVFGALALFFARYIWVNQLLTVLLK